MQDFITITISDKNLFPIGSYVKFNSFKNDYFWRIVSNDKYSIINREFLYDIECIMDPRIKAFNIGHSSLVRKDETDKH